MHKGYNNVVSSNGNASAQKFKFGGKELSEELGLNTYDFGARNYDPYLGRWMNIDPLAEKLVDQTPYGYVLNNPLNFFDPDGLYPRSVLKYDKKTDSYRFTNGAAHLLSLVSGVDKRKIQNTIVEKRGAGKYLPWYNSNKGGGAITLGAPHHYMMIYTQNFFEDDASKYEGHGYGQDIYTWLSLSSHEVGHIDQIYKEGSFGSYIGEFISQYTSSGNHDDADYEKEADKGQNEFFAFNSFIDSQYGRGSLGKLFNGKNAPGVITKRLDKWWKAYEGNKEKKTKRTKEFLKGLDTNLDNYSQGTYIWNGSEWVKKK